jgi:hypothetical protein
MHRSPYEALARGVTIGGTALVLAFLRWLTARGAPENRGEGE